MIKMIAPDSASDKAGIWKNRLATIARTAIIKPTIKKPPIKLKSLRVVKTYADNAKKMTPVPPREVAINSGPLASER